MSKPVIRAVVAVAVAALALPAAAAAGRYPPPSNPGKAKPRSGGSATLKVCKQRRCRYHTIQSAVNAARAGDKIFVANGTYKEGVKVTGHGKDGLKLIGNRGKPNKVFINAKGKQNGIQVNGADGVSIDGFSTQNYLGNGFFVVNVNGYALTHLVAKGFGTYGIYAFNSKGGTMTHDEAYYNNDSGFYIGQTPPQTKPKRSIVDHVKAWGNVLGWSGTNMRYVTIRNSDWYNNGVGIVPNALKSEKYPPPSFNVITGNRVFWNNFNYWKGAPFKVGTQVTGEIPYPVGVGILLFGSQDTTVEKNQIFGNYLVGFGELQQVLLAAESDPKLKEAAELRRNVVRNNMFGLGGQDLNARDLFYDGSGTENCFSGNTLLSPNLPADNSTFASCPGPAQNSFNQAAQAEAIGWAGDPSHEGGWIKHPHKPIPGITPLENYTK